jgi:hypothetical protein
LFVGNQIENYDVFANNSNIKEFKNDNRVDDSDIISARESGGLFNDNCFDLKIGNSSEGNIQLN